METFVDIENYEGLYAVGNETTVKSVERDVICTRKNGKKYVMHYKEKILRQVPSSDGYLHVTLHKNGIQETKGVHVLMAQAFLPNPNNYEHVHHKDHNPSNNHVENLEWISNEEHRKLHGTEQSKTVYQYTLDGLLVNVWKSVRETARVLGFNPSNISACCLGKLKTAYGYAWSYSPLETKKSEDLNFALI